VLLERERQRSPTRAVEALTNIDGCSAEDPLFLAGLYYYSADGDTGSSSDHHPREDPTEVGE
jgi:hypothetical protein